MGTSLAPAGELAEAIAEQRRKPRRREADAHPGRRADWDAHMPLDAPGDRQELLARLKAANTRTHAAHTADVLSSESSIYGAD